LMFSAAPVVTLRRGSWWMSRDAMGYPRTPYWYPEVLANWVIIHLKKTNR
jgi:hypothetical protein